ANRRFRFTVSELKALVAVFSLPPQFTTSAGDRVDSVEALAVVCRRLAEPLRWEVCEAEFGRSVKLLSGISAFLNCAGR
ncbi:TPA: hypothetical protein N0F65_012603, partial [Lagenidium giganteum]